LESLFSGKSSFFPRKPEVAIIAVVVHSSFFDVATDAVGAVEAVQANRTLHGAEFARQCPSIASLATALSIFVDLAELRLAVFVGLAASFLSAPVDARTQDKQA